MSKNLKSINFGTKPNIHKPRSYLQFTGASLQWTVNRKFTVYSNY